MKSVYMICGLGNSGKSTYAKKLQEEFSNEKVVICSVDEFRNRTNNISLDEGKALMIEKVKKSIDDFDIIIIDFSFDTTKARKNFLDKVNLPYNIDFHCIFLQLTADKIIENGFKRNPKWFLDDEKKSKIIRSCDKYTTPKVEEFNFEKVDIKVITSFEI